MRAFGGCSSMQRSMGPKLEAPRGRCAVLQDCQSEDEASCAIPRQAELICLHRNLEEIQNIAIRAVQGDDALLDAIYSASTR